MGSLLQKRIRVVQDHFLYLHGGLLDEGNGRKSLLPKDSELKTKNCYDAPCKSSLIAKLNKVAKDQKLTFGHDEKHLPDKSWIVKMLGHLLPSDEIFEKDYVPPPVKKKKDEPKVISLPSRFLKGLPTKPISKRRSRVRLKLTMEGNKKIKELRAKEKKEALRIEIEMEK